MTKREVVMICEMKFGLGLSAAEISEYTGYKCLDIFKVLHEVMEFKFRSSESRIIKGSFKCFTK